MMKYLLILTIFCFIYQNIECGSDRIKLTDLSVITLYEGHLTIARRSRPIPQMECVGGSAKCAHEYLPRVVQCKNQGNDGFDVQWKCEAELHSNVRFGRIEVSCEGYDYPDDKYILRGSCGLRYALDKSGSSSHHRKSNYQSESGDGNSFVFVVALIVIVMIVIYYFCIAGSPDTRARGPDQYHDNQGPNAPPPPGFRPEFQPPPPPYDDVFRPKETTRPAGSGSSGPGFWSGLFTGGAAGYLFGSRSANPGGHSTRWRSGNQYFQDEDTAGFSGRTRRRSSSPHHTSTNDSDFRTASGFGGTTRR